MKGAPKAQVDDLENILSELVKTGLEKIGKK